MLIDKPMYRIYIFKTPSANYFYIDIHHSIMDGISLVVLMAREIDMNYQGKKIKTPASYAELIAEENKTSREDARNFWREMFKNFGKKRILPPGDISEKPSWQIGQFTYEFKNISHKFFRETGNKETNFFMLASMLAISKSAKRKKSLLTWIHNGRTSQKEMRLFGLMIEQLPVALDFSKNISVADLLKILEEQMADGLKNRCGLDFVYDRNFEDGCATFIFQKKNLGFQNYFNFGGLNCEVEEIQNNFWSALKNTLNIEVSLLDSGNYFVTLDYDTEMYSANAMKNFAELIDKIILQMQTENSFTADILN